MIKKTISLLLIFMIIFTMVIGTVAFGVEKNDTGHLGKDIKASYIDDGYKTIITLLKMINKKNITDFIIRKAVNELEKRKIKILTIGNSFSEDATYWIYDIAKSAGVNVTIGNLYLSGCPLKTHWTNAFNDTVAYTYYKWTSSEVSNKPNQTMESAILDEEWDFITFQQSSDDSGVYDTFQPYLKNLVGYVKGITTNNNLKLALNMTWAYSSDSKHEGFKKYDNDQINMYNKIVDAYKRAIEETDIDIIIPCGTAIQNARTNEHLIKIGDELTRDGYHLNEGIGRYITGLTFFETLIVNNKNIEKDLFKDVPYIPNTYDSNPDLAYLAKIAVKDALRNPFKITEN